MSKDIVEKKYRIVGWWYQVLLISNDKFHWKFQLVVTVFGGKERNYFRVELEKQRNNRSIVRWT